MEEYAGVIAQGVIVLREFHGEKLFGGELSRKEMSGYPKKTDIPTKSRKKFCDFFSEYIYNRINHCITEANFIADFKKAEVCPPYKNDVRADKSNHMTK